MRPPVFVIGNPRSGTTLLRLMLNNHKNIIVPPECGFAVWWYDKYKSWNLDSVHSEPALGNFLRDLAQSKKIETWNLDFASLGNYIHSQKPSTYAELISCVYVFFGISKQQIFQRWGDKNNFHIRCLDTLNAIFPDALFIHIIRDGRDVACSYRNLSKKRIYSKYAPHLPSVIDEIAHEWVENVNVAISQFEIVGWNRVCEVRYEDLVGDSQVELTRICEFLSEPYDASMLNYHVHNKQEQQEPVEFLQWKKKTLELPTTSQVGKFLDELTKEEIRLFESIAKPVLDQYDYQSIS